MSTSHSRNGHEEVDPRALIWDAIIVGSGFGGAMIARQLVRAGQRVLMLERGGWVTRGPENWGHLGAALVTPHYNRETPIHVVSGWRRFKVGAFNCVGGASVFYGGASFRFRESDFEPEDGIVAGSGADWPFRYPDIEPYYAEAERILHVAGEEGSDPTEPPRSASFPQPCAPLSPPARLIADSAARLGLRPVRIPLAITYKDGDAGRAAEEPGDSRRGGEGRGGGGGCIHCGTCDGYACAVEAKNDIATGVIPALVRDGLALRVDTVCVGLLRGRGQVTGVEFVDRHTGQRGQARGRSVVLAAGSLATPHLLLGSGLEGANPAGSAVGRYLTRHCNAVVLGLFARRPNPERVFDKQVALLDFYRGTPEGDGPPGTLGSIQQLTPSVGLVKAYMPPVIRHPAVLVVSHSSGLLVIAEDQPRSSNGVAVDRRHVDRFGLPRLTVHHRYSRRDRSATRVLIVRARRVLQEAGALLTWVHTIDTFSHALGTVRMGPDERNSPLDGDGRFRGFDNLYVADGSALPRSAGVNPSLTIAANALRIGARLAGTEAAATRRERALPTLADGVAEAAR